MPNVNVTLGTTPGASAAIGTTGGPAVTIGDPVGTTFTPPVTSNSGQPIGLLLLLTNP